MGGRRVIDHMQERKTENWKESKNQLSNKHEHVLGDTGRMPLFIHKGWIDICFIIHNNNNNNNTHTHTVHCQNTCPCEMNWKGSTSRRENRQQCPIAHIRIWHFGYSCWVFLSHRVGTHHFRPRCGKKTAECVIPSEKRGNEKNMFHLNNSKLLPTNTQRYEK